jgi:hypothetical protein
MATLVRCLFKMLLKECEMKDVGGVSFNEEIKKLKIIFENKIETQWKKIQLIYLQLSHAQQCNIKSCTLHSKDVRAEESPSEKKETP